MTSSCLDVATYNIRLGIQQGLQSVADVLLSACIPDIVAVQEIGDHWRMGPEGNCVARLSRLLDLPYRAYAPTIEESVGPGETSRYGHALFSRWPIETCRIIELPQRIDEPRALLSCRIVTPDTQMEFVSTHLSHRDADRPEQGQFLRRWLREHNDDAPIRFLLGDLNTPPDESWLSSLICDWTDADAALERPTFPAHAPCRRIDYILATGKSLHLHSTDVPQAPLASDHLPLITRWKLPSGARRKS